MPDLSIIFDMGVVALRFLMPVYAIIIVYQCFAAMRRRRRPETPLISLLNPATGEMPEMEEMPSIMTISSEAPEAPDVEFFEPDSGLPEDTYEN